MHKPSSLAIPIAALLFLGTAAAQQSSSSPAKPATHTASSSKTGTTAKSSTSAKTSQKQPITDKEKESYAIGMNIGHGLKMDAISVDPNMVAQGMKDALTGAKPLLSEEELKDATTRLRTEVIAKKQAEEQRASAANKQAGEQFLAANKAKQGVVTLPSGLQYKVLKEGTGPKPKATDTVVCNYRGTLVDGTEFDSSYKHGEPATFPVNRVIKGWTEALQLMPVGSKWQLVIPPDLAYGERGAGGGIIGPDATLIFDVELLSIKGEESSQPASPTSPQH